MKYERPYTENEKANANKIYFLLKKNGVVTKRQMLNHLGWGDDKDRQLRYLISMIAQKVPIIATSDQKGYKMAQTREDIKEVKHQWAELSSRVEEIEKRITPLINFMDRYQENIL